MKPLLAKKEILIIDDDPTNLKIITEVLKGSYKIFPADSGRRALHFMEESQPDLVLLDIEMPDMDGYQVMERIKQNQLWADIPVIFLTGHQRGEAESRALQMGAADYIPKPIIGSVLSKRVQMQLELDTYRRSMISLVDQKTHQLMKIQNAVLDILANVTSFRDNETGAHILRTTEYVKLIVDALQRKNNSSCHISHDYAENIIKTAKLHDIGKVAIADSILLKPDRLSPQEYERIKQHTTIGAMMIDNAIKDIGEAPDFLTVAREIVYTHHECWDGSGYPQGLVGEDTPLAGRIMAIADVYDALISRRPYKSAFTHENAMFIIQEETGTHFDPRLISVCQEVFPQFEQIAETLSDDRVGSANEYRAW